MSEQKGNVNTKLDWVLNILIDYFTQFNQVIDYEEVWPGHTKKASSHSTITVGTTRLHQLN